MKKKILHEINLTDKIPHFEPKAENLIFNNRPTQDDVDKAEKNNQFIIILIEMPELSCSELIAFSKGYLKGLGIEKFSPIILHSYMVSEIIDYEAWKESYIKNYLEMSNRNVPWFSPAGFQRGKL